MDTRLQVTALICCNISNLKRNTVLKRRQYVETKDSRATIRVAIIRERSHERGDKREEDGFGL